MAAAFLRSRIPPTSSPQPPPSSTGNSFQRCLPSAPPISTPAHRPAPPPLPESTFVRHASPISFHPEPPPSLCLHLPLAPHPTNLGPPQHGCPVRVACSPCSMLQIRVTPVACPASHRLLLQHDNSRLLLSLSSKSADLFYCGTLRELRNSLLLSELSALLSPPPVLCFEEHEDVGEKEGVKRVRRHGLVVKQAFWYQ